MTNLRPSVEMVAPELASRITSVGIPVTLYLSPTRSYTNNILQPMIAYRGSVCKSDCQSVPRLRLAKIAERIMVLFKVDFWEPKEVISGPDPPRRGERRGIRYGHCQITLANCYLFYNM